MKYLDSPQPLAEAVDRVSKAPWAAVDTEADSLHHYFEKLCLLQISVPGEDYLVDPLVPGFDPSPLVHALAERPLILHGADFDIRILKRSYGFSPREIFDTMIAAQILGYERQGLADLVERHCGIRLSKSSQKADWSQRPLTEKMLEYAVNDTLHLDTVSRAMKTELSELGRLEWHRQFCARLLKTLSEPREERVDFSRDWQIKGSKALKGKSLTLLKALWHWREEEARRRDRPSFKILNTDVLLDIAQWSPANPGLDVGMMPKAPSNVRHQLREPLNRVIKEAEAHPQAVFENGPRPAERKRWTNEDAKHLLLLKAERQKLAESLKIHPSLLATNAVLEIVSAKAPKNAEELSRLDCLLPWQIEVFGVSILKAISS